MIMDKTLILDNNFKAIQVTTWKNAFCLVYLGKAEIISAYDNPIHGNGQDYPRPSVIRINSKINTKRYLKVNRHNVFKRDKFQCAYCGDKFSTKELTLDHIIPKSQGGELNLWENLITACGSCNQKKADNTPKQANMPLLYMPIIPQWTPKKYLVGDESPDDWISWLW
jgi:5-methylcytosine-specific restriction endonuclease McrA